MLFGRQRERRFGGQFIAKPAGRLAYLGECLSCSGGLGEESLERNEFLTVKFAQCIGRQSRIVGVESDRSHD